MKNRLEIAREFLRDDGVIFVQCDDNEQAYLKVLMDEIFGRENFISSMPRKTSSIIRVLCDYEFQKIHDYILVYGKNKIQVSFKKKKTGIREFKYSDNNGEYLLTSLQNSGAAGTREARPNLYYPIYQQKNGCLQLEKDINTIAEILPSQISGKDCRWLWSKEKFEKSKNRLIVKNGKICQKRYKSEYKSLDKYESYKTWLDDFTNAEGSKELSNLIGKGIFSFPKSEKLLQHIIEISTQPNDIVMDFFLGSGTTAAVAHKMNRQYIGIEQMDYIESVSVERLKKVIEGEQGGVSKTLNWQGGGEFIYFELAKFNQNFMDKILGAKAEDILNIYDEICEKAFLNYDADSKILKDKKDDFKELNLAEQKDFLINILNKNMLYVNLDDIEDENYEISQKDKELNKDFYNE